jgi:hypothetical protein
MSDGTAEGEWHWTIGDISYFRVSFDSLELTSLTFPRENMAILTGLFHYENTCTLELIPDYNDPIPLIFVIIRDKSTTNSGLTTLLIYSSDNIPIQIEGWNFEINAKTS